MTLTPVAEQFRQRTETLRASLGDAIKEAADLHLGAGVLRVGVSPLYAQRLFVPACLQLHQQRPPPASRDGQPERCLDRGAPIGRPRLTIHALPRVLSETSR
jgi:DNA-binding transcriptional LysR family regulator